MKSKISTMNGVALLVFGCFLCLLGLIILSAMPPKGAYLIEQMDSCMGLFLTGASLLLPLLGLVFLKTRQAGEPGRSILLVGLLVSLLPAACILFTFISARRSALPGHVYESGTKRITAGMTKAQVTHEIGSEGGSSWDDHKIRLTYDLQIAWGASRRQFFVDLIDDKVVSAKIVRYGGEPGDNFFWNNDVLKDLKAETR